MDINLAIQEAMQKANDGDIKSAQAILANVLRQEPRNARAWYLLSQIVGDQKREIDCLKKVLEIEPNSQQARTRLQKLQQTGMQIQSSPSVPKVQQINSQAQPNLPIPKIKPVTKRPSTLLIVLLAIVGGMIVLVFALQIINAPDATQCVSFTKILNNNCMTTGDIRNTYIFGDITNTCDKPITNITLRGKLFSSFNDLKLGETTALQEVVLSPRQTYHFSLVVRYPDDGYLYCAADATSAYFVK